MSESTLTAAFDDLTGDVGFFLGWGRGANNGDTAWTTAQQAAIDRCVKGGLRNFYHCGYDWTFLRPIVSLALATGDRYVAVPDDFGGLEGPIAVSVSGSSGYGQVLVTGDAGRLYAQAPDMTGPPEAVSIETVKGTKTVRGQRWQLHVYPQADQAYTLEFQYYLNPDYLTGSMPYAYGGPQHAETLLESCLAVAEKILNDAATLHAMEFEKRLSVSMDLDRRNKPQNFGYNADRSDWKHGRGWDRRNRLDQASPVTWFGSVPS